MTNELGKEGEGVVEFLYKLLLTFNSTSFILSIFLIKENYYFNQLEWLPVGVSHIIFLLVPVLFTVLSLWLKKFLSKDSIECGIKDVEIANHAFLPSYLGYFFVALSVGRAETMVFVYGVLFIFTFLSQTLYFNPVFLIFRYHFYYVTTDNNIKHFIISKREIRTTNNLKFVNLRRINIFTYIDMEDVQSEPCCGENTDEKCR